MPSDSTRAPIAPSPGRAFPETDWEACRHVRLPSCFVENIDANLNPTGEGDSPARCTLANLPLQVSSTKPLFVQWYSPSPFTVQSRLKVDSRIQRLAGTVTNPLNVNLRNCRLMFENWTYELNDVLEPGETIDVETETKEKTAKNFLTRRKRESNKGKNSAWNPADSRIWRIADMLMFYELARWSWLHQTVT